MVDNRTEGSDGKTEMRAMRAEQISGYETPVAPNQLFRTENLLRMIETAARGRFTVCFCSD